MACSFHKCSLSTYCADSRSRAPGNKTYKHSCLSGEDFQTGEADKRKINKSTPGLLRRDGRGAWVEVDRARWGVAHLAGRRCLSKVLEEVRKRTTQLSGKRHFQGKRQVQRPCVWCNLGRAQRPLWLALHEGGGNHIRPSATSQGLQHWILLKTGNPGSLNRWVTGSGLGFNRITLAVFTEQTRGEQSGGRRPSR